MLIHTHKTFIIMQECLCVNGINAWCKTGSLSIDDTPGDQLADSEQLTAFLARLACQSILMGLGLVNCLSSTITEIGNDQSQCRSIVM